MSAGLSRTVPETSRCWAIVLHGHGEIEEYTLGVRVLQFSATGCLVAVAGNEDVNIRTHSVCLYPVRTLNTLVLSTGADQIQSTSYSR